MSEIDAMKSLEDALHPLDESERTRVLDWACAKYIGRKAVVNENLNDDSPSKPKKKSVSKSSGAKKGKYMPRVVKDLNLVPTKGQAGKAFAEEKNPTSVKEKCVVSAYYLRDKTGIKEVSVDHVYTFFKAAGWPIPANIVNTLQQAGSEGWLDTSDQKNILVTPMGENLIEHELPRPSKKS